MSISSIFFIKSTIFFRKYMSFLSFDQIIEEKCAKIKKNYGFRGKVKSALPNQVGLCKADGSLVIF